MHKPLLTCLTLGAAMALPMSALGQDAIAPESAPASDAPAAVGQSADAVANAQDAGAGSELATIPVAGAGDPAPPPPPPGKAASRLIEEIVVTAQKREENIQDVPIAITAFSAEKLEALGIDSAQSLDRITPGLTITNAAGFNVAYLRGVGTDAFLPGADPSVPFYLDGVALLGAQGSSDTLGRVQRVEVLKGPQGTLFGRNATGGAISIITPDPENTFSGDVNLEYGNYDASKVQAYVNVPITDSIAASLSGFNIQQDNFVTNDTGPIIDVYSRGGRAKLRWQTTDDLAITLAGSYQKSSNDGGLSFENTRVAPILGGGGLILPEDPKADRHLSFDSLAGARTNSQLYSATFDWKLPVVDIKLIGSQQRLDAPFVQADFDKSNLPIINIRSIKQLSKQRTAELQFLSNALTPGADKFQWVAGLFYLDSSGGFDPIAFDVTPNLLGQLGLSSFANSLNNILSLANLPQFGDGIRVLNAGVLESTAYSAYAQGTYKVLDTVDLTLGVRYQKEDRNLTQSRLAVVDANGDEIVVRRDEVPTLHSKQTSPRVALQWRPFGEGTQIYSSYARGYKSPTYNTVNVLGGIPSVIGGVTSGSGDIQAEIKPVKAEHVDSYEIGVKTDLLDRNLRLNSAVFYTKQTDLLTGFVALASGGVVAYDNAPGAEIKGAEFDFVLTPLPDADPGLVFTGAFSYLDAQYTDYPNGKGFDEATGLAFGTGGTEPLPARDFKGNRIVRTPKYTYNLGISQTVTVTDGSIEFGADSGYNSGFFFLPQNSDLYKRDSYTLYNARVTYIYDPWSIQVSAFVNNLTDKDFNQVVFVDDFGRNQVLNAPRTFGLRAKWTF